MTIIFSSFVSCRLGYYCQNIKMHVLIIALFGFQSPSLFVTSEDFEQNISEISEFYEMQNLSPGHLCQEVDIGDRGQDIEKNSENEGKTELCLEDCNV